MIFSFTGWAQREDFFSAIAPGSVPVPYLSFDSEISWRQNFSASSCDLAVGWSLGGVVLLRALAAGHLHARAVLLLATPYHFMHGKVQAFNAFEKNFIAFPQKTLSHFSALIAAGDQHAARIRRSISPPPVGREAGWGEVCNPILTSPHLASPASGGGNLACWLEFLGNTSLEDLNFSALPPTLIIHGDKDAVVAAGQGMLLHHHIPESRLMLFDDCGHAPHLHAPDRVQQEMNRFLATL